MHGGRTDASVDILLSCSIFPYWLYYIWATCIYIIYVAAVPSSAPTVVDLEATSRGISLSWEALLPQHRNGIIMGYTVAITDLDDTQGSVEQYHTEHHNLTISELTPYTTYGVLLSAYTEVGFGPTGDLHTFQTREEGQPNAIFTYSSSYNSYYLRHGWT